MKRIITLGLFWCWFATAGADTTLMFENQHKGSIESHTVMIKGSLIGIVDSASGERVSMVFDKSQSAFTFIDHRQRQYTVISEAWMEQAMERTQAAMKRVEAEMQKQMQNMPPQYRGMYQQGRMMMPMMGGATTATIPKTFVPAFGTHSVAGMTCRRVDVLEAGRRVQELCVTDPKSLKIPTADYDTFRAMLSVTESLAKQGAFSYGFKAPPIGDSGSGSQGIPILVNDLQSDRTTTLRSASFDPVDDELLKPPSDYLEAKIPLPSM